MLNEELKKMINEAIQHEHRLSALEADHMSASQHMSWQGFKRLFRCMSRDRLEHALCFNNFMVEYYGYSPTIAFSYVQTTYPMPLTLEGLLRASKAESEAQIARLKNIADMAIKEKEDLLMGYVEKLMKDEYREWKWYNRILKEMEQSKKMEDASYISRKSMYIHDKMKKKEKGKGYKY